MKLISWNVNGIRAALKKGLDSFVESESPDIVCFQEIKAREEQVPELLFAAGYNRYWNSADKPGYSGTAIFSRVKPLKVTLGIGDDAHDREGRVITAEYADFQVVNVYTPNSKRDLSRLGYRVGGWEPAFRAFLKTLDHKKPWPIRGPMCGTPGLLSRSGGSSAICLKRVIWTVFGSLRRGEATTRGGVS